MANQLSFSITARNSASTAMNSLQKQVSSLKNGLKSLTGGTSESTKSIRQLNTESSQSTSLLSRMGQAASRAIGIFTGFSVVSSVFGLVRNSIDTALSRIDTMDLFEDKMTMITGSAEQATWALDQLKSSTKGTPYALDQAAKAVQNFVLRGMDAQSAVDSVNIWMDAVSAYGNGTNEQLTSVLDAIAKMRTKGTVEMRYLNRLFAAGINPVQMYATATGQAASEVQTALSNKTINTTEFLNVVETAMREGTNGVIKVQGKAKELAKTWTATLANMRIAIGRGMAEIIQGLDDAFKVINPDSGLKGVFKAFGETMENIMDGIAVSIKAVLPPILSVAKSAYDFWVKNFFEPINDYFARLLTPLNNLKSAIKQAFTGATVDLSGINYDYGNNATGNAQRQLVEVFMSWQNLKRIVSQTQGQINNTNLNSDYDFKLNIDNSIYDLLVKIDDIIGSLQNRIPDLLISFNRFSNSLKQAFGSAIETVLTLIGGIIELGVDLGSIIIPPSITGLTNIFEGVASVLSELTNITKNFIRENLPSFIEKIRKALSDIANSPLMKSIADGFDTIVQKVKFTYKTVVDYVKYLNNQGSFAFTPTGDTGTITRIMDNLIRMVKETIKAFEPLKDVFDEVFNTKVSSASVNSGFSNILNVVERVSDTLAVLIPKIVRTFSKFAADIIRFLKPVGTYLLDLGVNYIVPFLQSVARVAVELGQRFAPLISGFIRLAGAVASFIIPLALQILTNIMNWIADHADFVAAGIITVVSAILAFKTISAVTSVISVFSDVLMGTLIPAVSNFFTVMTTEGIGAALATLANPIVLIGVAVVAFIALAGALIYLYNTSDTAKQHILDFLDTVSNATPALSGAAGHWEEIFSGLGDTLKWLGEQLQNLQDKLDAFFDNLPEGFRSFFGSLLSGPGYSLGGILGDNSDATKHTIDSKQLEQNIGSGKLSGLKFQIPDLNSNLEQWRKTAKDCTDGVGQVVTQELPKVGANLTSQVQTIQGQVQSGLDSNPADPTAYLQNVLGLPFEGGELGTQTSTNLTAYAQEVLNNSQLDPTSAMGLMYGLPTEGVNLGSGLGLGLSAGVSGQAGTVNESTSALGLGALSSISQYLGLDQAILIGANFMNALTAGINVSASNVYMSLATFANNCLTQISAGFANTENVSAQIGGAMLAVIETVTASIDMMCQNLIIKLNDVLGTTMVTAQIVASSIETYFTNAQTNATTAIDTMCTSIIDRYNLFLTDLDTIFTTFQQNHNDLLQSVYPTFLNNVSVYLDLITDEYRYFETAITTLLDDLKNYHKQAGIDMMVNLRDGIASKMGEVVNKASELVQQLKKTFEEGLGIHSPSRYMFYIGQMLLAGLMGGLAPDKVQTFIDGVVGDMQGAFDNGKYTAPNADEAVNFLSDQGTLDLIGRVSKVDTKDMNPQQIAYPLIGTMGTISSPFGNRSSPGGIGSTNHAGMDIASPTGTPIASALAGTVTTAGWYGGYGNAVVVDSGNGLSIVYGHMSQVLSSVGQVVQKGQQIGLVGSTGNSTGPHLHFEMRNNGDPFDPAPYLGGAAVSGVGNTLAALLQMAYNKKHGIITGSNVMYNPSAGAAQWSSVVLQALAMLGQPASLLNYVLYAIERESSGNPNAINLTDSNAAAGHPSQGLLQTIPSTFAAYRNPNLANSLTDPLANIYAGLNYMIQRYGGIEQVVVPRMNSPRGWYGYAVGTRYVPYDMPAIIHQGEAIIPASQNPYSNSGGDYLGDLIANAMNSSGLNSLGFDTSSMTDGGSTNNNTTNNNLNNVFNITNSSDVDSDRSISEMESMLHRMLQDGKRVGVPR